MLITEGHLTLSYAHYQLLVKILLFTNQDFLFIRKGKIVSHLGMNVFLKLCNLHKVICLVSMLHSDLLVCTSCNMLTFSFAKNVFQYFFCAL